MNTTTFAEMIKPHATHMFDTTQLNVENAMRNDEIANTILSKLKTVLTDENEYNEISNLLKLTNEEIEEKLSVRVAFKSNPESFSMSFYEYIDENTDEPIVQKFVKYPPFVAFAEKYDIDLNEITSLFDLTAIELYDNDADKQLDEIRYDFCVEHMIRNDTTIRDNENLCYVILGFENCQITIELI